MAIDYKKLARSNTINLKWRDKLINKIRSNYKDPKIKLLKASLPAVNFFGMMMFFKNNKKEAAKLFGPNFLKDYKDMFYAAEIENELIKQYIPAIYSILRNKKINPILFDELINQMICGFREVVWRFNREDLQFSTYAITSLKNNFCYEISNLTNKKKNKFQRSVLVTDKLKDCFSSFSGRSTEQDFMDKIPLSNFMERIINEVKFSKAQKNCLIKFLNKQSYIHKTMKQVKEIIKKHITEQDLLMPQMEEIVA